jgi:predicted HicB family RNase H-like nuclease
MKKKGARVQKSEIVVQFTLPTELHTLLKSQAALAQMTLKEFIRDVLQQHVEKGGKD